MSEHFSYESQIFSQTARRQNLNNTPSVITREKMKLTAAYMEVVRVMLGENPIYTSSWYRSAALNRAIKGSLTSQHGRGEAVDFTCTAFGTPLEVCKMIQESGLPYDQLIFEGDWVHISFTWGMPRREVLTAVFGDEGTTYVAGLGTQA